MLVLLAAAQVHRLVVAVLDMQPDGVLVESAAGVEVDHIEHDMAAADDIERRIEDGLRDGHGVSFVDVDRLFARHSGAVAKREPGMLDWCNRIVPTLRFRLARCARAPE